MPYLSDIKVLLQNIDANQPAYLLIASHPIRIELLERELLSFLSLTQENASHFFGDSIDDKGILGLCEELRSNDLFTPQRLIRLTNAHKLKTSALDIFLKSEVPVPPSNILLLHASQLKSNSRLRKHFAKKNALIELPEMKEAMLGQWAIEHAKSIGMKIGKDVAQLAVSISEESPDGIHQILHQLQLYCEQGKAPTVSDLSELFHYHPDPNEFQLLEKVLTKPPQEAEDNLRDLLDAGKNAFSLLNLMGKSASRLLLIRALINKGIQQSKIASIIGAPPWLVKKEIQLLQRANMSRLRAFHKALITADAQLKGKSLGMEAVFSQLLRGGR